MCYRQYDHHDCDTNMLVERLEIAIRNEFQLHYLQYLLTYSFHNKHKTNPRYLAHKVTRRVDDLIHTLLTIEEDLFFDRKHKEIMRDSSKLLQIKKG